MNGLRATAPTVFGSLLAGRRSTKSFRNSPFVHVHAVRTGTAVSQDGEAVGVTGEHPKTHLVAMDRCPLPEFGIQGKRIARPLGIQRIEDGLIGCRFHR